MGGCALGGGGEEDGDELYFWLPPLAGLPQQRESRPEVRRFPSLQTQTHLLYNCGSCLLMQATSTSVQYKKWACCPWGPLRTWAFAESVLHCGWKEGKAEASPKWLAEEHNKKNCCRSL
eukprot:RCo043961